MLTALVVAETGFLDRPVTVQSVDTMCDPVKLESNRARLISGWIFYGPCFVKSPNDVARCLARDNAGSIEAFAQMMNRRARATRSCAFALCESEWSTDPGQYSSARDLSLIARAAYANRPSVPLSVFPSLSSVMRMVAPGSLKTRTNFFDGCLTATA